MSLIFLAGERHYSDLALTLITPWMDRVYGNTNTDINYPYWCKTYKLGMNLLEYQLIKLYQFDIYLRRMAYFIGRLSEEAEEEDANSGGQKCFPSLSIHLASIQHMRENHHEHLRRINREQCL